MILIYCWLNYLEPVSTRLSCKRGLPDAETEPPPPPSKRPMISLARLQELEAENSRLKKQIEKFRTEWMRTFIFYKYFDLFIYLFQLVLPILLLLDFSYTWVSCFLLVVKVRKDEEIN